MRKLSRLAAVALTLAIGTTSTAEATVARAGATLAAIVAASRGNAAAYDPINHVYLVVSAQGTVFGRFVDRNGNSLGSPFAISGPNFAAYPRATFSPDANGGAGGFLITWSSSDSATLAPLHGRMVAFGQNGAYGAESVLSTDGSWWEEAAYGAYSTVSHEFLIVYRTFGTFILRAQRIGNDATPLAAPFTISQTNQFENNPSVAYNPVTNQYLACWTLFTAANTGQLQCRIVQPGNGALGAGPILVTATGSVWFTDTTYNPTTNQFLVTWDENHGTITNGRLVNADGSLPGGVIAISRSYAGYDGTATAYNGVSRSFFTIAYDLVGDLTQDGGVELTGAGQPADSGQQITAICVASIKNCGNFYPQIASSTDDPNWLVSTATSFAQTSTQLVGGQAATGTPTTPTTPTPPATPTPKPMLAVDTPAANASVSVRGFAVAGWAADAGATTGTGVDVVAVWAFPSNGAAAILAGVANYGNARPDVGAYLGAQFTNTGYGLMATLPADTYTLAVYAHSTVNNSWNTPSLVKVTVTAPPSHPMMWVDAPAQNQTLSQNVFVGGWAVDTAAPSGPGVDAIHVWAYPAGGTSPVFVGASSVGVSRPDIGAWLGPQFSPAGFNVTGTLAPGTYTLVVFAHSAVTGTFNNAQTIAVTVR